jgi:hypothetical protein
MTDEQRRDDYERSCEYATRLMREREVKEGRIIPRPGDYDFIPSDGEG